MASGCSSFYYRQLCRGVVGGNTRSSSRCYHSNHYHHHHLCRHEQSASRWFSLLSTFNTRRRALPSVSKVTTTNSVLWYSSSSAPAAASTPTQAPISPPTQTETADSVYQKALDLLDQIDRHKQQQEEQKSTQLFEAWQGAAAAAAATQPESSPRRRTNAGVVVAKTIANQTRNDEHKDTTTALQEEAQRLLQKAAHDYSHPQALVRLGNAAIENAALLLPPPATTKRQPDDNNNENKNHDPSANTRITKWVHEAMDFYERADSQEGWYNLGQLYWTGFPETDDVDRAQQPPIVTPDHQKALDCFKKAVEKGDADAMYFVGAQYVLEETSEGITKGLELIQHAADTGHPGALNYLASFFYHGSPVLNIQPASTEENVERLDKAAEAGDQDALYTRGHAFLQGDDGRPQHFGKAFEDFMQAAHKGHPEAAVSAGAMLFNGMGVAIDQTRAFEMYQLAGELGSKEGWRNVVACYTEGTGVKQCTKTAKYIQSLML